MTDSKTDPDIPALLADLTDVLEELESELEPQRRLRPPTLGELTEFTSEIAIPAMILVLRTNIRTLQLLQRTLRLVEGQPARGGDTTGGEMQARAKAAGRTTLSKLDTALSELQTSLESRPPDDEARDLLEQARELQQQTAEQLEADDLDTTDRSPVGIDVEAELQSIKDNVDENGDDGTDDEPDG